MSAAAYKGVILRRLKSDLKAANLILYAHNRSQGLRRRSKTLLIACRSMGSILLVLKNISAWFPRSSRSPCKNRRNTGHGWLYSPNFGVTYSPRVRQTLSESARHAKSTHEQALDLHIRGNASRRPPQSRLNRLPWVSLAQYIENSHTSNTRTAKCSKRLNPGVQPAVQRGKGNV